MTSESGELAMRDVTFAEELVGLDSRHARALWLFIRDRARFMRAEDILYADVRRYGKQWNWFAGPKEGEPKLDNESLDAFKAALRIAFDTANVEIEIFERTRPSFGNGDGAAVGLTQVAIYREDRPNDERTFIEGELTTRTRYPVIEASVTYEPKTGVIECVASQREIRSAMACGFGKLLLGCADNFEACAARGYDLTVLQERLAFPTEPQDRIESVSVTMLRLKPIESESERVTVENSHDAARDIWTVVDQRLGEGRLSTDYVVTQARLVICYRTPESNRVRRLPILITHPDRSSIKEQTDFERSVSAKYLPRWGLAAA